MAQRTRKVLLWDGSYTKDGAFGDCNANNRSEVPLEKGNLHVPPSLSVSLVVPKISARIVRTDRFLKLERPGRKTSAYATIELDLKGIDFIENLLLVIYPRPGLDGSAKPVYRELIEGNDKIRNLLRGKRLPSDTADEIPEPPSKAVEANYFRDSPYTVKVWISKGSLDPDALKLDKRRFLEVEPLKDEEKNPKLAHDKSMPSIRNFLEKRMEVELRGTYTRLFQSQLNPFELAEKHRGDYEGKKALLGRSCLGLNQIAAPFHKDLKLVFVQTTHTVALPPLERSDPRVRENLALAHEEIKEPARRKIPVLEHEMEQLRSSVPGAKESVTKADQARNDAKKTKREKEEALKVLEQSGKPEGTEGVVPGVAELKLEIEELTRGIRDLDDAFYARDRELRELVEQVDNTAESIEILRQNLDMSADAAIPDEVYFNRFPDEYKSYLRTYLDGLETLSAAQFDHRVLRKVPMDLDCPTCGENKAFCRHTLQLERLDAGADAAVACARTAQTSALSPGKPLDRIGSGGTTRTSYDAFMSVFCDHDGGTAGALSPIEGFLFTVTDDNYAHNVAAAAAFKALVQRPGMGEKRLVLNFDQHVDCGNHSMDLDRDRQVKITCATWGQFTYYESPSAEQPPPEQPRGQEPSSGLPPPPMPKKIGGPPMGRAPAEKLRTPFAPHGKPMAHGYVAIGTLPKPEIANLREFQAFDPDGSMPSGEKIHDLEVNTAAAVMRRAGETAGSAKTTETFKQKTFKHGSEYLYQKCHYKDLLAGADPDDDVDPLGVKRKYHCPECGAEMTPSGEDPKIIGCTDKGHRVEDRRQGIEDVYHDKAGGEADWSRWHVFITIDRDFFIGNGTGWNDGRSSSHKGRELVLKCVQYLVEKKATIVGFDICGIPDQTGVAGSRFLGGRPLQDFYTQLADDIEVFCRQLDELLYAREEGRKMKRIRLDGSWTEALG